MAIFDPPHLENRSTDFDETWNLELPPEDHPACKTTYRCFNVGGLGEHPVCHCKFLSLPFFISSSRAQVAPGDRSAPKLACKCGFGQGGAFWGSRWWPIVESTYYTLIHFICSSFESSKRMYGPDGPRDKRPIVQVQYYPYGLDSDLSPFTSDLVNSKALSCIVPTYSRSELLMFL